ncbi:putative immunity protein [Kitasatospora sp. NPDC088346]|uniref:putative immunity protein n=1 Tax=Kitasatospora sp. NPDC088346 TaxID=3364073 RepID=UPI00381707C3
MTTVTISDEDRRILGLWAAARAERVLPLFETEAPDDPRPREALAALRLFTTTGRRTAQLRSAAWAAHRAAREVGDPAAAAAARAACYAAAAPFIHALASPHQAKHIHDPAVHAALARELSAGDDHGVGDEELGRAIADAPPAVRALLRQLPERRPGRSRSDVLRHRLDTALRG